MVDTLTHVNTRMKGHPVAESLSPLHIAEVLQHLHHYTNDTFVIKIDDILLDSPEMLYSFAQDIVLMKQLDIHIILVHGCHQKKLADYAKKLAIDTSFIDGHRVMTQQNLEVAEMIMSYGSRKIVSAINSAGGMAIALSGRDNALLEAKKLRPSSCPIDEKIHKIQDLGYVGEPIIINPDILLMCEDSNIIPVVSSIGVGEHGESYYLSPTIVATSFSTSLLASKLIFMSNDPFIMHNDEGHLVEAIDVDDVQETLMKQKLSNSLEAKVKASLLAIGGHTEAAHILDARIPHILLSELFSSTKTATAIEGEPLFYEDY